MMKSKSFGLIFLVFSFLISCTTGIQVAESNTAIPVPTEQISSIFTSTPIPPTKHAQVDLGEFWTGRGVILENPDGLNGEVGEQTGASDIFFGGTAGTNGAIKIPNEIQIQFFKFNVREKNNDTTIPDNTAVVLRITDSSIGIPQEIQLLLTGKTLDKQGNSVYSLALADGSITANTLTHHTNGSVSIYIADTDTTMWLFTSKESPTAIPPTQAPPSDSAISFIEFSTIKRTPETPYLGEPHLDGSVYLRDLTMKDIPNFTWDEWKNDPITMEQLKELAKEPPHQEIIVDDTVDPAVLSEAMVESGPYGATEVDISGVFGKNLFLQHAVRVVDNGVEHKVLMLKAIMKGIDGHNFLASLNMEFISTDPSYDDYLLGELRSMADLDGALLLLKTKDNYSATHYNPRENTAVGPSEVRDDLEKGIIDERSGSVIFWITGVIPYWK